MPPGGIPPEPALPPGPKLPPPPIGAEPPSAFGAWPLVLDVPLIVFGGGVTVWEGGVPPEGGMPPGDVICAVRSAGARVRMRIPTHSQIQDGIILLLPLAALLLGGAGRIS